MSADELRRTRLRQIGFRRGYDPVAVDDLLIRLADDLATRDRDLAQLERRLDHAQRELYARRHGHLPHAAPHQIDPAAIDAQLQAQRYAEELVASAQQNAAAIVEQSRVQATHILRHAHASAERAAHEYRARAGASYSADREELVRLATLARWAMGQVSGLRAQVDATDDAARAQLATIIDRLGPLLDEPSTGESGGTHGSAGPWDTPNSGSTGRAGGAVPPFSGRDPAGPPSPGSPGAAVPGPAARSWTPADTQPLP